MIKSTPARQRAIASALGSVKAEGLQPSSKSSELLERYANGKMSAKKVRSTTIAEMKSTHAKSPTKNN